MNIMEVNSQFRYFVKCRWEKFVGILLRIGCIYYKNWHYLNYGCICTVGKVLKVNRVYIYKETGVVEKVRFLDFSVERRYIYCRLRFLEKKKTITVCQILRPDASILWRIYDEKGHLGNISSEFPERLEVPDDLLEFEF
jgi:hypothetical protein